ncbi:hypothetical protein FRC16_008409 [Serendipita sp. 398]|nr:hypothetical protein FRC16_008409 [Serendipita sp. 398]
MFSILDRFAGLIPPGPLGCFGWTSIASQWKMANPTLATILTIDNALYSSTNILAPMQERFGSRIKVIARPSDADTATLRGAAAYGLARRPLVSSIVVPRAYIMRVKLPAEQEDYMKRPAYIQINQAGTAICENRFVGIQLLFPSQRASFSFHP